MDVFKPFLQRLSQPILLSFCIAWIFWNWEIVVALCWYDAKNISRLGYDNHMEYIETLKDPMRNYIWPLCIAFLYPFIILVLNNFHTLVKKWEEKLFTKIVKNATVPTDLYLDAQDQIEAKEKRISKFISKETEMEGQINDLTIKNKNLENKSATLGIEYSETLSIKKDLEDKLKNSDANLLEFEEKSSIDFLIGNYEFAIYERLSNGNLVNVVNSNLHISRHENQEDCFISFKYKEQLIESQITEYFYNILNNNIGFKTLLIKSDILPNTDGELNILHVLKNELMNNFVTLSILNFKDLRFIKNIKFKDSDLRMDLTRIK